MGRHAVPFNGRGAFCRHSTTFSPPVPPVVTLVRMSTPSLWTRLRESRLGQVLLVYVGVSWVVIQIVSSLQDMLALPAWLGPVTLIILAVGLIVMLATAWVQSHPTVHARARAEEVPSSWELDLADALRSVRSGRIPHLTWSRALIGGAVAFGLLFGTAGLYVLVRGDDGLFGPRTASAGEAPDGIAVLPFSITGSGIDEWREGMVDLLSTGLDGAGGVRAIASRTVLARWHEAVPDRMDAEEADALRVARGVGARYALLGSAVAIGPLVRLMVQVHELTPTGSLHLGQAMVEGVPDSVLVLVDRLGMETLALIFRADGADLPTVDLARITTASLPALKSYLKGEAAYRSGDFGAAAAEYERAMAADSLFALAHWRLSQALGWNETIASPRAREANARALAMADRLPERESLLVRASMQTRDGDPAGVPLLQQAVQRYPDDAEAWYQLGDAYLHINAAMAGWDEAEAAFERAVSLAPRMASYQIHLIEAALRQYADSATLHRRLDEFEQVAPGNPQVLRYRRASQLAFGDSIVRDSLIRSLLPQAGTSNEGPQLFMGLSHPQFFEARAALGQSAYPHTTPARRRSIANSTAWGFATARGQIRAALQRFDDPAIDPLARAGAVLDMYASGLPVPADEVARAAAHATDVIGPHTMWQAAHAARHADWDRYDALLSKARALEDSLQAAGDSMTVHDLTAGIRLLDAYATWQRGEPARALAIFEELSTNRFAPNIARWWAGMLHLEAGNWTKAEPYFRSFNRWSPQPLGSYYLGQIYERTNRPAQAREMFAFFAAQWANADPELQPLVQDARARLIRLDPERAAN